MEDDLRADERDQVQAHVASCAICDRDLSELRDTVALLHGLRDQEPPPLLADAVMSRIRAGEAEPPRLRRVLSRFADPGTGLALAAGVAGLLVFATLEPLRIQLPGRDPAETREATKLPVIPTIADYAGPAVPRYRGPVQTLAAQPMMNNPVRRMAAFGPGLSIPESAMPVPWPSLGDELNHLRFNPQAYVMQLNSLSPDERSRTLARLANHAVKRNAAFEAFYLLRFANQPGNLRQSEAFEKRAQLVISAQSAQARR